MQPQLNPALEENVQQSSEFHWLSAIQFGGSLIAILLLWGMSAILAIIGLLVIIEGGMADEDVIPFFLLGAGLAFCGVLLIPSAWYSLMRLLGRSKPQIKLLSFQAPRLWIVFLLLLFPVVVILGDWITSSTQISWLFLPPLHVLAIGIPILGLVYLGVRGLSIGSPQRDWGAFGAGMTLSPVLILILEIAAIMLVIFAGTIYLLFQPDLLNQLELLTNRLYYAPPNPQIIQGIISPFLAQPLVVYTIFAFTAVIVPLIEEALKPIGAWLLFRSNLTPAAGFAAGILGGAGYAIFENIMFSINISDWIFLVTGRAGTSVMHILTGGITGWALVNAWRHSKYLQLGLIYLAAVFIHGLWNGFTLLGAAEQIVPLEELSAPVLGGLIRIAPYGLGFLVVLCFGLLVYLNWNLRRSKNRDQSSTTQ